MSSTAAQGIVARAEVGGGRQLVLHLRNGVYTIRVDGRELMSSRAHGSEEALARWALHEIAAVPAPRVLVGGLGLGYTLRAALEGLPGEAMVVVAELSVAVVAWCRGPLGHLTDDAVRDPRVHAVIADVHDLLEPDIWDVILLDVDNGPGALSRPANQRLYDDVGVARIWSSLRPGGVVATWSAAPAPDLGERLAGVGFGVWSEEMAAWAGERAVLHTLVLARRPADGAVGRRAACGEAW